MNEARVHRLLRLVMDVACGKHGGTRTVAVATGRFQREQLETTGADAVFEDFADVASVIEVLMP